MLDVGANAGQYAASVRAAGYAGRIVSFEPQAAPFALLRGRAAADPSWDCHRLALGTTEGVAELNVARDSRASSLLEWEAERVRRNPQSVYVGAERVAVRRLDALWAEVGEGASGVYLKIDTEGYELEVLEGAEASLPDVDLVEVEIGLTPLWRGAPTLRTLLDFLEQRGFVLVSVERVTEDEPSGRMLQVDAIFARQ
jgi:FkbM family methyltransferase